MDYKGAGPGVGVVVVLVLLGMLGEAQAPRPPNRSDTIADYSAAQAAARSKALYGDAGFQALKAAEAEAAAAERARRYAALDAGEELYRPDPFRQVDCGFYPEVMQGRYSPRFEAAMKEKFWPGLTDAERAAWERDRLKRWADDKAGKPGPVCDPPPGGGAGSAEFAAWEERGRKGQRVQYEPPAPAPTGPRRSKPVGPTNEHDWTTLLDSMPQPIKRDAPR